MRRRREFDPEVDSYGRRGKSALPTQRLFLHCFRVQLRDASGSTFTAEAQLPPDLLQILQSLKYFDYDYQRQDANMAHFGNSSHINVEEGISYEDFEAYFENRRKLGADGFDLLRGLGIEVSSRSRNTDPQEDEVENYDFDDHNHTSEARKVLAQMDTNQRNSLWSRTHTANTQLAEETKADRWWKFESSEEEEEEVVVEPVPIIPKDIECCALDTLRSVKMDPGETIEDGHADVVKELKENYVVDQRALLHLKLEPAWSLLGFSRGFDADSADLEDITAYIERPDNRFTPVNGYFIVCEIQMSTGEYGELPKNRLLMPHPTDMTPDRSSRAVLRALTKFVGSRPSFLTLPKSSKKQLPRSQAGMKEVKVPGLVHRSLIARPQQTPHLDISTLPAADDDFRGSCCKRSAAALQMDSLTNNRTFIAPARVLQCLLPDVLNNEYVMYAIAHSSNEDIFNFEGCQAIISLGWNQAWRGALLDSFISVSLAVLFAVLTLFLQDTPEKVPSDRYIVLAASAVLVSLNFLKELFSLQGMFLLGKLRQHLTTAANYLVWVRIGLCYVVISDLAYEHQQWTTPSSEFSILLAVTVLLRWAHVLTTFRGYQWVGEKDAIRMNPLSCFENSICGL
ncbi:hypothetical protein AK812_SmicGene31227 [Symbiodinium microadriaticum]|uniref:Uncharacterized protein n=1 Tax=Symbiodinium microadriaticum TaxID=2951 RepID=A0A1Q9CXC5_SYMMI|nr:hypothetical protein AK812_SmicGene31227 [Symbiodinium microadriaticum]